jgi:asparagine synthase (glutamine-hydrolysing)
LLHDAIYDGDRPKWSQMILVGQFVILGKRFGVKQAAPEFALGGKWGREIGWDS